MLQRRHHPLGEMVRIGTHQRQLHPPPGHVQGITDALGRRPRQPTAYQLSGDGEHQPSRVLLAGIAGPSREVLHAAVLEVLETVEGETGVGDHTHKGGEETPVEGAGAAFLFEDCRGRVDDARVDVLACYLEEEGDE